MSKAKASKKKAKSKGKKSKSTVPKSLRDGVLPTSVSEVMEAGLGALREAQSSGSKQFDSLVKRGRTIQSSGSKAAQDAARQVENAVDQVMGSVRSRGDSVVDGIQDRFESVVEGVLSRLGLPTLDEVQELQATVDALEARVLAASTSGSSNGAGTVYEVRHQENGWAVRQTDADTEIQAFKTKKEALYEARALARQHVPSTLVTYRLDGTVGDTTTYDA